ncbi:cyclodeaminase/cyclohydrolase family protein [Methylomonas sp. SURF-1]|uniref:Cyclodeaminase/cyclohydrolase family protein n=1 Tax=Methylomonas aurea TaxID=2952224 RepID=A0ABT1UDP3_9GAMM|nr:methenyltetrahydrofolate cyclohydrolase [Methylomonas sp. SURF-1]MCQ8180354.1 cyclodeaminase/cyclohydrolase family protein [Methylomonas sp. SURF-1]
MSEIKDKSIELFLDELASKQATPGGGSAAAVMGAQAAALVSMVCNLTIGKPKYAAVEPELRDLLVEAETLRQTLIGMIKADVDVFDKLMACYGLPKNSDQEKAYRSEQIQSVLKEATLVPLACAKACAKAVELSRIAAEKGNLGVISDAGVAVMAAYAGLKSAALNVQINAASLKDRVFAEAQLAELGGLLESAERAAADIYQTVRDKL